MSNGIICKENNKEGNASASSHCQFAFLGNYAVFCFFYVLFLTLVPQVILGFITYSREELLNIRAASTHHQYDQEYDFREADPVFCLSPRTTEWIPASDPKKRLRKRGKRSGLLVRLRRRAHRATLPSILLANVQSLDDKIDEIRARVAFQRDIRDCNVLCFTETWLTGETLSESVQPAGFSTHRADRNKHLSGKKRGGGVCFMVNVTWCGHNNIQELKSFCSPDLEFLTIKCRPHYLPREFSSIIITAVYIPPQADTSMALNELYLTLCRLESIYPEAAFIVAGDFNKANLKTRLPKLYQHIDCTTRAGKTLDHCYSNFRGAYKALPRSPFGKADHDSILLIPAYRQKLKQEAPALRSVQRWSDQSDSTLQDCFHHVDWVCFVLRQTTTLTNTLIR
ncbi:uncharacterized protein LOC127911022 [Oncorhynchus keta]|uniref:uncharacterized protein LOC127911022 n=1 Tax=Oncorhynchus keta TaxID=8018 RepID=UPI00227A4FCD|nr:uncharacterized protein LOC127911022 [Oncorhynchus keta]